MYKHLITIYRKDLALTENEYMFSFSFETNTKTPKVADWEKFLKDNDLYNIQDKFVVFGFTTLDVE
jgi:hypothetical protein